MSTSSSYQHHHHLVDRSASRLGKSSRNDDVTHLLDPSYSSYRRTSADESSYNPFEGLGGLAGRRGLGAKSRIGREPSEVDSVEDGGMSDKVRYGGGLSSGMGSGMGGSGRRAGGLSGSVGGGYSSRPRGSSGMSQAGGGGSHRSRNQADLSLRNESIINGIDYSPRRSSKSTPRDRQLSTASSLARVPAPFQAAPSTPTTTNATKSRRSTLLSSAATTWEEEEGSRQDDYEELEPPPAAPSRYHSAWDYSHKNYAPSSPSSVVSSASPQLFPETPAQQESRRRSQEVNRMATIQSSSAHHRSGHSTTMHKPAQPTSMSALLPPPRTGDSIFGDGSEKGGSVTGGGRSGYQPMKWKNERAGLRGGVDDDYRPPPLDQTEWTPGCTDNIKRSWSEISLAVRFSLFRTKKKLERKAMN